MSMNDVLSYTGTLSLALSGVIYYYYKSSSAQYDSLQKARHSTIKQLPHLVHQHTQYANASSYPSSPLYVCVEGIVSAPAPLMTRWPSVIGNAASKAIGIYHVLTETSITTKLMPLSRLPWYDTEQQPRGPDIHSVPFTLLDPNDRTSSVSLPALSTLSLPTSHGIESLLRFAGSHFISSELKYDDAMQNFQMGEIPKGTRFDEQMIPVDTRMTVFGHATMDGGEVKIGEYDFLSGGTSPTRPFFVSSQPYSHIIHHAKQERSRYYYALIGTLFISCSSYMVLGIKYGYSYYQTRQEMARLETFRIKRRAAAIKKKRKQQQQLQLQQQQQQQRKARQVRRTTTNKNTTPTSTPPSSRLPPHPPTLSSQRSRSRYDDEEMEEKEGFPSNEGRHAVSRRPPPSSVHHRSSSRTRMMSDPHDDESEWDMDTDGGEWDEKSADISNSSSDVDIPDISLISDESDVSDADTMCVICLHVRADAVMLDCGHMYTCVTCAEKCHKCPVCRANIKRVVKVFSNA